MKRSWRARVASYAAIALLALLMIAGTLYALCLGAMGVIGVALSFDGGTLNGALLALSGSGLVAVIAASVCGYRMLLNGIRICRLWLRPEDRLGETAARLKRIARSGVVCAAVLVCTALVWSTNTVELTLAKTTLAFAAGYLLVAGAARLGVMACRRHATPN